MAENNKIPGPLIESLWRWAIPPLWVAYAAVSFFLLSNPEHSPFAFALLIPIQLLVFFAHECAQKKGRVFGGAALFLSLAYPVYLAGRIPGPAAAAMVIQALSGLAGFYLLSGFFKKIEAHIDERQKNIGVAETALKAFLQENQFYSARIEALSRQIGSRQKLVAFAREMGTILDPVAIQKMLVQKTRDLFPEDEVSLRTSNFHADPVDAWVNERRFSILLKEFAKDPRFSADPASKRFTQKIQSVIETPLVIERSLLGMIRVDSKIPNRFAEPDLEQLDVYAHLSTLALENAHLFARVNSMATRDGLTGLATHRIFQEKLAEELLRAARYHKQIALVMLDIDHFKSVNDSYGHLAGDEVLKSVAQILRQSSRPVDFPARYGGEEFVVILPEIDLVQAAAWAEEIRKTLEERSTQAGEQRLQVTASFGCAAFPQDAQSAAQLVRTADQRMYAAKSQGRNRVVSL